MKTNNYLKITGILMIIGGALGIIVSIVALLGVAALAALGANSALLTVSSIVSIVGSVFELIAGIQGVKGAKDPAKGAKCVAWGIVIIVLEVLSQVLSVVAGGEFGVVSMIIGLVLPILYTIGAFKAKKELTAAAA